MQCFFGKLILPYQLVIESPTLTFILQQNPRRGTLWESYGDRLEEWCNYSDFACCATGNTFAGHISYFSNENGTITADFVSAKYNAAIASGGGSGPTSSRLLHRTITPQWTILKALTL
jgi:hypothetical protein